jgi:hypothetical protein
VKNFIRIGGIILIAFSILPSSTWTFASEEGISKTQGPIMRVDFKKNSMVVNEKTFIWNKSTVFTTIRDPSQNRKIQNQIMGFHRSRNRRSIYCH